MIGLDTNVIVRYLSQDDPVQSAAATAIIEKLDADHLGFVSTVALVETCWVLRRAYGMTRSQVADTVRKLLSAKELVIEQAATVHRALDAAGERFDLADALISESGQTSGCDSTVTFDTRASKLPGMRLAGTPATPTDGA